MKIYLFKTSRHTQFLLVLQHLLMTGVYPQMHNFEPFGPLFWFPISCGRAISSCDIMTVP